MDGMGVVSIPPTHHDVPEKRGLPKMQPQPTHQGIVGCTPGPTYNNNNNNNKTNNNNNKLLHLIEIKKLYDCMTCIIHLATLGDFFGMVNWRNKNSKVVGDLQCLGIKRSLWITWSLRTRAILIFFCCKGISECQKYAFQSFQISNSMFLGFTLPKN